MAVTRLTLNVLLSLIIQCKITGKGLTGNGKLLVKLIEIIENGEGTEKSKEWNILKKFNDEENKPESYHKIDKLIGRFLPNGKNFPYDKFIFSRFENSIDSLKNYGFYLIQMKKFCNEVLDKSRYEQLVYTLLEIIRHDNSITNILYDSNYIPKERLFGSFAHPKKICIEALLLGLFYHVFRFPAECGNCQLLPLPDRLKFSVIRIEDNAIPAVNRDYSFLKSALDLEMPVKLETNLKVNAKRQEHSIFQSTQYPIEFCCEGKKISVLPVGKNIFLYGQGGIGKTTFMLNLVKNSDDETVYFYFPMNQYKYEVHENFMPESCNILVNILLKYHYQYEYQTYESAAACEGEETILKQLTDLLQLLKINNIDLTPQYTLLLDGLNEMSSSLQESLVNELERICAGWKNVRFIVSGRTVPQYDLFRGFQTVEVLGIPEDARNNALSELPDYDTIIQNNRLTELFKSPLFLNIYLQGRNNNSFEGELNTREELLDYYVKNYETSFSGLSDVDRKAAGFILHYALHLRQKQCLTAMVLKLTEPLCQMLWTRRMTHLSWMNVSIRITFHRRNTARLNWLKSVKRPTLLNLS